MIAFSEDPEEQLFKVYSKKSFDDYFTQIQINCLGKFGWRRARERKQTRYLEGLISFGYYYIATVGGRGCWLYELTLID